MTIDEADNKIIAAGGSVEVFWNWMRGQTMGLNDDGTTDVYEGDVARFMKKRMYEV